jgi:2-polyprenyl-3-methyl-5-hydroxy-6-metoxy-1,4-benzoquinol methylase
MDQAWAALELDEYHPDPAGLNAFYRHPIWIQNGYFVERDPLSLGHRLALVRWLAAQRPTRILDYGGGFGTVARMLAANVPQASISVYEPFPTGAALAVARGYANLAYVSSLTPPYTAILALDVLEHLCDPLGVLHELSTALVPHGLLILANHFYPVIRCHLPGTFHLRYSFDYFAALYGLQRISRIPGSHATVYRLQQHRSPSEQLLRRSVQISQALFPLLRNAHWWYRRVRGRAPVAL